LGTAELKKKQANEVDSENQAAACCGRHCVIQFFVLGRLVFSLPLKVDAHPGNMKKGFKIQYSAQNGTAGGPMKP